MCFIQTLRQLSHRLFLEEVSASHPVATLRELRPNRAFLLRVAFSLCRDRGAVPAIWWHVSLKRLGSTGRAAVMGWRAGATCGGKSTGHRVPAITAA